MSTKKRVPHNLKDVTLRELGIVLDKEQQTADWRRDLAPEMLGYAARDSEVLLPLAEELGRKVEAANVARAMEIEHRALPAVVWMSNAGVPFDAEGWGRRLKEIEAERARFAEKLNELAPDRPDGGSWNWAAWQQVLKAFALLGIELPNVKEETLVRCDHPLASALLSHKKTAKVLSTYGASLLERVEDGRIYAAWRQIGAGTGRMACSKPNLQNLPPEVRQHVRAPEGRLLVKADYSQIELRIAAKISGDETMLGAYHRGEDLHTITAMGITGQEEISKEERKLAKAVNFGLIYGQGAQCLKNYARSGYGVEMSLAEAERYRRRFFETYPGIKRWHERESEEHNRGNTETRTLIGRRRTGVGRFTERLNSPVQGTGADGLKLALALLWERRHECPGVVPILAVHDEVVVECDEAQAVEAETWLKKAMIDGMGEVVESTALEGATVPIEVETRRARVWG